MFHAEDVYYTLLGETIDDCKVPGVENLFFPGSVCDQNYNRMLCAYEHLCQRLNQEGEDADIETIVSCLLENQRIIALKMYEYGKTLSCRGGS